MLKRIFALLVLLDMLLITVLFVIFATFVVVDAKPRTVTIEDTELAIVTEKHPETLSISMDVAGTELRTVKNQELYDSVELGDKIVFVKKYYQYWLKEPRSVSTYQYWDDYVAEAGAQKAQVLLFETAVRRRLQIDQQQLSRSNGPRAGIVNEIR